MKKIFCVLFAVLAALTLSPCVYAYGVPDGAEASYTAASEATVLLKNENNALPLTSTDKIALFGEGQVYTDGKTGGFFLMGRGSGYFVPTETPQSPCDLLTSYVGEGKLGGVYADLVTSYKNAAVVGEDFTYSPTDDEYAAAAAYADKAVYIVTRTSAEGSDHADADFYLNTAERTQLQKICAAFAGKPVIVVLNTGVMLNCGFANGREEGIYADAVLAAGYLGIRGTQVVCETLVGDINPSGKTVGTYAKLITDYPSYASFRESNDYTVYSEDIYIGYRYFETFGVDVDYEFGFGLSYTTFALSDYTYTENDGKITVSVKVTNTGDVAGKEVVQIYFGAPQKGVGSAVLSKAAKELCGFAKTDLLAPGASQTLTVSFDIADMASYDDLGATGQKSAYVLEAGDYAVYAGTSVKRVVWVGTHNEPTLRVVEQLSMLCEPTTAFERMTYDGTETVGAESSSNTAILHQPTAAARTYSKTPHLFSEVVSGEITVEEFLSQMSDDELCETAVMTLANGVTGGVGAWGASVAVAEKYGIPVANTADGPAGLRISTKATGLPSATALASTWNTSFGALLGDVVGREALKSGVDVWLAPGVNLHRFPLCGRNFEYYSEDPYLSGVMAAGLISEVESHGVATSVKHFVGNEKEKNRNAADSRISERALRELYLKPFRMAVNAGVSTVMTSYNLLNGRETSESAELIRGILRGEWGFDGVVTTDWTNDSDLVDEILAGNNVKSSIQETNLPTDGLKEAVRTGRVSRSLLIENASYMMRLLAKLPDGRRLADPVVTTVSATGETRFEAEDYTLKHGSPREEISGTSVLMSYTNATGEMRWLSYTLNVEEAGSYILSVVEANNPTRSVNDAVTVSVNGVEQTANYMAVSTSSWSKTTLCEVAKVELPAGKVTLKIKSADGIACGNFDYFTLMPFAEVYTAIDSAEALLALMGDSSLWDGKYYLTRDIDLGGVEGQSPIGTTATNFTGSFDGCGHSIRGLALDTSAEADLGLFGKAKNAVIRDLAVYGSVTSSYAGAAVGGIVGTADPGTIVVGCENHADVTYQNSTKAAKGVGGVAGYLYAGSSYLGTVVKDCKNGGTVVSNSGGNEACVGGIAGIMNNNGTSVCSVLRCENEGAISGDGIKVGGIVGYVKQAASGGGADIIDCRNDGSVTSTKGRTGGIVGYVYSVSVTEGNAPTVERCMNTGRVHGGTGYELGGILGFDVVGTVSDCVNLGEVTGDDGKEIGGVVGKTYTTTNKLVSEIRRCYTVDYAVIPDGCHEKPDYFVFTDCATATEEMIRGGETALPLGRDGYVQTSDGLAQAALLPPLDAGDVNADGRTDVADVLCILRAVLNGEAPQNAFLADINEDGGFTLIDILIILRFIAG